MLCLSIVMKSNLEQKQPGLSGYHGKRELGHLHLLEGKGTVYLGKGIGVSTSGDENINVYQPLYGIPVEGTMEWRQYIWGNGLWTIHLGIESWTFVLGKRIRDITSGEKGYGSVHLGMDISMSAMQVSPFLKFEPKDRHK